jgi:hypothetical protein
VGADDDHNFGWSRTGLTSDLRGCTYAFACVSPWPHASRSAGYMSVVALVALALAPLVADAASAASQVDVHRRVSTSEVSACRIPRLTGLVLAVARERSAKAGCRIRLTGSRVQVPRFKRSAGKPLAMAGTGELSPYGSTPHCRSRPGEPGAGTITVRDPLTSAIVASETVARGHLATIPLAPGTYTIQGTFANATINGRSGEPPPTTVEIQAGKTVRQDVFLNVK